MREMTSSILNFSAEELEIQTSDFVVAQGRQENLQKGLMNVQYMNLSYSRCHRPRSNVSSLLMTLPLAQIDCN